MVKRLSMVFLVGLLVLTSLLPVSAFSYAAEPSSIPPLGKGGKKAETWIEDKIKQMTLEEKVGQLFMIHVYGRTPADTDYEEMNLRQNRGAKNFVEAIQKYHIGGIIYFNWTDNIGTPVDPVQVNALSNGLQEAAMEQRTKIPLFIATDQEGGVVARVTEPAAVFPGNMALGAGGSVKAAERAAEVMGTELKSLGINMTLAPTLDVNVNPENPVIGVRSYSEDAKVVRKMGLAQVKGFQSQNVSATVKHFPGHGDTNVDSHYGLPIIHHDLKTLEKVDLMPFKHAIRAGVDAIMTAHIVVPSLDDSGLPATLSKPILTDLLRKKMKFDGIIITDSLGMSGANVLPPERVPVEAFKAGADILLNPPNVDLAYNAVLNAVKSGEITEKRIDESVFRILMAKLKRGLFHNPYVDPSEVDNVGMEEHLNIAEEITEKSITLIKNEANILPLETDKNVFVTGPTSGKPTYVSRRLEDRGISSHAYATNDQPTNAQITTAVTQARDADVIVVTAYTANTNKQQQQLVQALKETGIPVVVASMRNPYDIMAFPDIDGNVLAYGNRDVSVRALVDVLTGKVNPSGKLPVTLPGLYERGFGLSYEK